MAKPVDPRDLKPGKCSKIRIKYLILHNILFSKELNNRYTKRRPGVPKLIA